MSGSTPKTIGKYEVLSELGEGGMGIVYKARDPFIDRIVAIKTIKTSAMADESDLVARLRMEAKSAGRLQHPNIVTIFEFGEQDGLSYLVMEFVEGANLANVIASGVQISLNTKLEIITQLCDGVGYAHDSGVIHRDLKPSNVCLTQRGDPKILDFGLARFDQTRLTKTGLTSGTLLYMSPERMRGESGPSDDIFALGAIAYEILTGNRAFPGKGFREIAENIMSGKFPIPASKVVDVPGEFDAVIARATAVTRTERYDSAHKLATAFREVQHSQTFKRRANHEDVSIVESMKTVAIRFAASNPYTAPEIKPPSSGKHEANDITEARTEARPIASFPNSGFGFQPTMTQPVLADNAIPPTILTPRAAVAAAVTATPEPKTVVGVSPRVREAAAAPAPVDSLLDRTRTVVAKVFRKGKGGEEGETADIKTGAVPASVPSASGSTERRKPRYDSPTSPVPRRAVQRSFLYGGALVLALAIGALGVTENSGIFARLALYGAAVAGWYALARNSQELSKVQVAIFAVSLCALAVILPDFEPSRFGSERLLGSAVLAGPTPPPGAEPPFASLLLALWTTLGGGVVLRRLLGAAAILCCGWLLWDKERKHHALAVMTFPLLLMEGVIYARLELVATAFVLAAGVATIRRRYGLSALSGVIAAGTTISAAAALPVLYGAAWYMIVFLASGAVTLIVPKIILPSVTGWSTSFPPLFESSPFLTFLNGRVSSLLTEWGVIDLLNAFSKAITTRADATPRIVSPDMLATFVIVVALFVTISIIAAKAPTIEAALADGLAVFLLLTMTRDAALWMLVAPFAILSSRRLWLFVSICSPLLLLASAEKDSSLLLWALSLVIPTVCFMALRLKGVPQVTGVPARSA